MQKIVAYTASIKPGVKGKLDIQLADGSAQGTFEMSAQELTAVLAMLATGSAYFNGPPANNFLVVNAPAV